MPTYQLTTAFAQQDLSRLYAAGANVVVAKPNAGGRPNVAWIVFRPLISNVMAWEDKYGIYASSSQIIYRHVAHRPRRPERSRRQRGTKDPGAS